MTHHLRGHQCVVLLKFHEPFLFYLRWAFINLKALLFGEAKSELVCWKIMTRRCLGWLDFITVLVGILGNLCLFPSSGNLKDHRFVHWGSCLMQTLDAWILLSRCLNRLLETSKARNLRLVPFSCRMEMLRVLWISWLCCC